MYYGFFMLVLFHFYFILTCLFFLGLLGSVGDVDKGYINYQIVV